MKKKLKDIEEEEAAYSIIDKVDRIKELKLNCVMNAITKLVYDERLTYMEIMFVLDELKHSYRKKLEYLRKRNEEAKKEETNPETETWSLGRRENSSSYR